MNTLRPKKHCSLAAYEKRTFLYVSSLFSNTDDILFLCACLNAYRRQKYKKVCSFDSLYSRPCFYKICGDVHSSTQWEYIKIFKRILFFTSHSFSCQKMFFSYNATPHCIEFLSVFFSYLNLKKRFLCFMDALDTGEKDFFSDLLFCPQVNLFPKNNYNAYKIFNRL